MSRNQRRNRAFELGVVLLLGEIFKLGIDSIPPVTLITVLGQVLLYAGLIDVPWDKFDVCLSGHKVWNKGDFKSLLMSNFEHGDDMHLYYNMISFLVKGRSLEIKHGTANFLLLLLFICVATPTLYVGLAVLSSKALQEMAIMSSCAIGFSGVIFALKFITTVENNGYSYVAGIRIPLKYSAWAELIAIHMLVPNASFMGHLAGILTGFLYMKTPVGSLLDIIIYTITGRRMRHFNSSYSDNHYSTSSSSSSHWRNGNQSRSYTGNAFNSNFENRNRGRNYDGNYPWHSDFYDSRPTAPPDSYDPPGWRFQ